MGFFGDHGYAHVCLDRSMSCVARADLDRWICLYHVSEQVLSYTDAVYMLYLSIASAIDKCADMPLNASGLADCADTEQPG